MLYRQSAESELSEKLMFQPLKNWIELVEKKTIQAFKKMKIFSEK
jgi:hypothetical protein